jgi:hypothetical protein
MLMSPVGVRLEKSCAGDDQQKLKITDPTSRQRGRPTSTNQQLPKNYQRGNGKNRSRIPDGCLTPRQTGRLTVGRTITCNTLQWYYCAASCCNVQSMCNLGCCSPLFFSIVQNTTCIALVGHHQVYMTFC